MWSYFRIQNRPISNGHGRNTCCAFPEHQLYPEIQSPICGFNIWTATTICGGRRVGVCVEGVDGCGVEGVAREGLGRPESAQRRGRGGA